jgi:electron transfer flavoprotein beta subunit
LNEPRYTTLPNIMKAKKRPLDILKAADLQTDMTPRSKTLKVEAPHPRKPGIKVNSVEELITKLRDEAKVI